MKITVNTLSNKKKGDLDLNPSIFDLDIRKDILHRVVLWQLAKRRAGTHKTKNVSEVSGSGKKPFRQKGTGNARQGSKRATIMRGGAVAHGPKVRSYEFKLPKKVRKLGLKIALSSKLKENKLLIIDELKNKEAKTSSLQKTLNGLNITSALFVDNVADDNFVLALRNMSKHHYLPDVGLNVYDILKYDYLVITEESVKKLEERLA